MADLEKLDNAINELEKHSNDLKEFNIVYAEITKLQKEISENLNLLKASNQDLSKISKDVLANLNDFQKKIDELYKDNKSFQKELDGSIATRLEKHKSDVQIDIRNEGKDIRNSLGMLSKNIDKMDSTIKEGLIKQSKKASLVIIFLIISMAMSIGIIVAHFITR
jgi:hypothetical protein